MYQVTVLFVPYCIVCMYRTVLYRPHLPDRKAACSLCILDSDSDSTRRAWEKAESRVKRERRKVGRGAVSARQTRQHTHTHTQSPIGVLRASWTFITIVG